MLSYLLMAVPTGAALLLIAPAAEKKTKAQLFAECQEEIPRGRQADRSTRIKWCIERKKQEQGGLPKQRP